MKLQGRLEKKPWGQTCVPHAAASLHPGDRIGEVIFDDPSAGAGHPILIKCLYTSERMSIQVHPDDRQARKAGHAFGKDEMWIVLEADPKATIGIGLKRQSDAAEMAKAIADGSIVDLIDWKPVQRGDVIYNRAGTIHAVGAGLVLLEVQQAADLTYRLYDYDRSRELHVDQALAVARFEPHFDKRDCRLVSGESRILADGPYFGVAWCAGWIPAGVPRQARNFQLLVVEGSVSVAGRAIGEGEAAFLRSIGDLRVSTDAIVLLTWPTQEALTKAA